MWKVVAALLLLLNVVTVALYGYDKWQSRRQGRRIRERTLLWCIFLGGWIGAWLAMSWFRHKTQKQPFRLWAILWTVLNLSWPALWWGWRELMR